MLTPLDLSRLPLEFHCGHNDLDDFFANDVIWHENELLTRTYAFGPEGAAGEKTGPFALISFSNDKIELKRAPVSIPFPDGKRPYTYLPAVKIGRLGVREECQGNDIGTTLLNMVKRLFLAENRTGCRILTVDAYNTDRVIAFYERSHFTLVSDKDARRQSRAMYYDLMRTLTPSGCGPPPVPI